MRTGPDPGPLSTGWEALAGTSPRGRLSCENRAEPIPLSHFTSVIVVSWFGRPSREPPFEGGSLVRTGPEPNPTSSHSNHASHHLIHHPPLALMLLRQTSLNMTPTMSFHPWADGFGLSETCRQFTHSSQDSYAALCPALCLVHRGYHYLFCWSGREPPRVSYGPERRTGKCGRDQLGWRAGLAGFHSLVHFASLFIFTTSFTATGTGPST